MPRGTITCRSNGFSTNINEAGIPPAQAGRLESARGSRPREPADPYARAVCQDSGRFQSFSLEAEEILLDYSRNLLSKETMTLLLELAVQRDLSGWIERMFAGQAVNNTERRAALHVALRNRSAAPMRADEEDVMRAVRAELDKMRGLVESLTHREFLGSTGQPITDVVNIGIGGSDLGAVMAVEALKRYRSSDIAVHFVSNVDGAQLRDILDKVYPETTLFIVCSKTFTTQETLTLAHLAKDWLYRHTTNTMMGSHFVGVSSNDAGMEEFGIRRTTASRFGTGSGGAIRCGRRSGWQLRWRLAWTTSRRCSKAVIPWTSIF